MTNKRKQLKKYKQRAPLLRLDKPLSSLINDLCYKRSPFMSHEEKQLMLHPTFDLPRVWGIAFYCPMNMFIDELEMPDTWTENEQWNYMLFCFSDTIFYVIDDDFEQPSFWHDIVFNDQEMVMSTMVKI